MYKSLAECKSESPEEALEAFEVAVRAQEMRTAEVQNYGESGIDPDVVETNYEEAKAELLTWMSYIP